MSKQKRYKRKGTTNTDILKSVLGSDYVSQYSEAIPDKPKQKNGKSKGSSKSPPVVKIQKTKSTPDSTPELPTEFSKKAKPLTRQNNQLGINYGNIITDLIKSFNFSYKELSIDFNKKLVVAKDTDKIYHVFGFDGKEQVKYSFNGNNIEAIK